MAQPFPPHLFRRSDESPDADFYRSPRLVTHIDDAAIAAVTGLYRELLPPGGRVLDLMSSWVSHLPADVEYAQVVGLGMNAVELDRNPRLTGRVVHDLNADPVLPFGDAAFDAAVCCVSIDYLTRPAEVVREVGRAQAAGPRPAVRRGRAAGVKGQPCGSSSNSLNRDASSAGSRGSHVSSIRPMSIMS